MKDGSYYEGEFSQGEINGYGYRFFSNNGCKYTGQFHNGELHGTGKMIYFDGSIYDGQWFRNRKHGRIFIMLPNERSGNILFSGFSPRKSLYIQWSLTYPDLN